MDLEINRLYGTHDFLRWTLGNIIIWLWHMDLTWSMNHGLWCVEVPKTNSFLFAEQLHIDKTCPRKNDWWNLRVQDFTPLMTDTLQWRVSTRLVVTVDSGFFTDSGIVKASRRHFFGGIRTFFVKIPNFIEGFNLRHEITMWTYDCVVLLVPEKVQSKVREK